MEPLATVMALSMVTDSPTLTFMGRMQSPNR
jgi:hypothetical protein